MPQSGTFSKGLQEPVSPSRACMSVISSIF